MEDNFRYDESIRMRTGVDEDGVYSMSSRSDRLFSKQQFDTADCLYSYVPLPSDEAWVYVIGGIVFLILLLWGWSLINLWVKLFFLVGILGTIGDGIRKFLDCLQYMEVKVFSHGLGISRLSTVYYFPWEQVHHVDLRGKLLPCWC